MAKTTESTLEMANFICRFGEKLKLLDMFERTVYPAFFGGHMRKYDRTKYFLYKPELILLEDRSDCPVLGIAGRFIKDTYLEREQIFDPSRGIIPDSQEMESAPSALFLLVLNTHRLLYVKETGGAPSIATFRSTVLSFLRDSHKSFIDAVFESNSNDRKNDPTVPKLTKKYIVQQFPHPTLEVIPLASEQSLEAFIRKYDLLRSLEIKLVEPNDEIDNEDFFQALRSRKESINSASTVLKHTNSKGLDKEETVEQLKAVASQGIQKIKMDGNDEYGDKLSGNNESFKIKTPVSIERREIDSATRQMYRSFIGLVEHEIIKVPEVSKRSEQILKEIKEKRFDE